MGVGWEYVTSKLNDQLTDRGRGSDQEDSDGCNRLPFKSWLDLAGMMIRPATIEQCNEPKWIEANVRQGIVVNKPEV